MYKNIIHFLQFSTCRYAFSVIYFIIMKTEDINTCRAEIDRLDGEILQLLNARSQAVLTIGRLKKISGKAVKDQSRENAVLERLQKLNTGPLPGEGVELIWKTIFSVSRNMETDTEI